MEEKTFEVEGEVFFEGKIVVGRLSEANDILPPENIAPAAPSIMNSLLFTEILLYSAPYFNPAGQTKRKPCAMVPLELFRFEACP